MKTTLVPIGNSRGVRIPKPLIEQCGLDGEIDLEVRDGAIVIRAPRRSRADWEQPFARMARMKDDALLDPDTSTSRWDEEEWQWK